MRWQRQRASDSAEVADPPESKVVLDRETLMRAALAALFIVVVSCMMVSGQSQPGSTDRPVAFTHVTVIDATGSPAQPDMTVVVTGNRISALGHFGNVTGISD